MSRNVMTKGKADSVARLMIKQGASAYSGRFRVSIALNSDKLVSEAACKKVLAAFHVRVLASHKYDTIAKGYAENRLGEDK
tara:strand:+ start:5791 stop:6033 length:243 start_codon:yes stop_codon:yes gene_type:complete